MTDELYLIDTSVWLEVLPRGRVNAFLEQRVDGLLGADRVAITGMIRLELLGGARSEQEWERLDRLLEALHWLSVEENHWQRAARMGFQLRRQGITVPFTDLLIASVALESGAVLLHRDRHFDYIGSHSALKVESLLAA